MEYNQAFIIVSLVLNTAIAAFMVKSLVSFFTEGGRGNMQVNRFAAFKYFTVLSNMLMAVTSVVMMIVDIILLASPACTVPYWVLAFKHVGSVAVLVTFTVVFLMFIPKTGFKFMLEGNSLYLHLISPLFAAISFVLFDPGPAVSYINVLWGIVPTVLYAVLYYYKVMIKGPERGGWEDFYKFNANDKWYLSAAAIFLISVGSGALLILGRNVFALGLLA